MGRLVINGEEIYELDEECLKEKREKQMQGKCFSAVKEKRRNGMEMQKTKRNCLR